MKKLINQIIRFGIVGVAAFIIDFSIYTIVANLIGAPYLLAGFLGFVISVIFNYILSMKYVFQRREDMDRGRELFIFILLSLIGLGLNELLLYICIDLVYAKWDLLSGMVSAPIAKTAAKIIATGVVMGYNFISRKLFLEGDTN